MANVTASSPNGNRQNMVEVVGHTYAYLVFKAEMFIYRQIGHVNSPAATYTHT